jgi:fructose-bisphosphate aldolase class II
MFIEIELGVTGGEEDGIYHSAIDNPKLYTQPEHVAYAYEELKKISSNFTIAAAFGMFMAFINLVQLFLNQLF